MFSVCPTPGGGGVPEPDPAGRGTLMGVPRWGVPQVSPHQTWTGGTPTGGYPDGGYPDGWEVAQWGGGTPGTPHHTWTVGGYPGYPLIRPGRGGGGNPLRLTDGVLDIIIH